jgi:hypothetical protein
MYIDLKQFDTSKDLQIFLDGLTLKDVQKMRKTILAKRKDVLRKVSVKAFADKFQEACRKLSSDA